MDGQLRELIDDPLFRQYRQYLELVGRWFRLTVGESFTTLLHEHRSVLKELREVLESDGEDGVAGMVPEVGEEYRDTLVRLAKESIRHPKELREAVRDSFKLRGWRTWSSHNPSLTHYWLTWGDAELAATSQALTGRDDSLRWELAFTRDQGVRVGFCLCPDDHPPLVALMEFIREMPINKQDPGNYLMTDAGYGWFQVYSQELLSREELVEMSAPEVRDQVFRRLEDFIASDESEYRRIDDYFRCLAYRPHEPATAREDSP